MVLANILDISISLLLVAHVVVSLLLILVVLMQRPKQEGLGAAFGGGMTDQMFGAQTTNVLQKGTAYFGTAFLLLSLVLAILIGRRNYIRAMEAPPVSEPVVAAPAVPAGEEATPVREIRDIAPEGEAETPREAPTATVPAAGANQPAEPEDAGAGDAGEDRRAAPENEEAPESEAVEEAESGGPATEEPAEDGAEDNDAAAETPETVPGESVPGSAEDGDNPPN